MLKETIPKGEILKFVESYWEHGANDIISFAPQGTFHIVFSAEPFALLSNHKYELDAGFYLLPINSRVVSLVQKSKVIVIRLKAFTFFNIQHNSKLFNGHSADYWSFDQDVAAFSDFRTKYRAQDWSQAEYLPYLESIVYELLAGSFSLNSVLRDKVNYILERKGQLKIKDMANDFGVSRQALHKYFTQHLLISPKELCNIWRMNHFLDLSCRIESLTASAIDAGFFDQAHSINEFKRYFKTAPQSFLLANHTFTLNSISKRFNHVYDPS